MTRAVVLGGSGFIGGHLVRHLAGLGQQVSVYGRTTPVLSEVPPDVRIFRGDFTTGEALQEALEGVDHCYHLISATTPGSSSGDTLLDIETNLKPTVRLLELARSVGVKKIIFCSSGGTVYGIPKTIPIEEEHPLRPINPYGIVKAAIEQYLNMYFVLHGLDYGVARLSNPYGEGQRSKMLGAVTIFARRALRGEEIEIWGDGSVVRDFMYIDDAVRGLAAVARHKEPHRIFNIGSGQGHSLNELLATIERIVGRNIRVKFSPSRRFDVPVNILSIDRAREQLKWSPKVGLEEGIERTVAWLRTSVAEHRPGAELPSLASDYVRAGS
jgi:UDP-glucose 4-epimerase